MVRVREVEEAWGGGREMGKGEGKASIQNLWVADESTGDGNALFLTAGK